MDVLRAFLERGQPLERGLITAVTRNEKASDAAYGRDRNTGEIVNFAIGQAILQILDHRPPIYERLELRRSAQIPEELLALRFGAETEYRAIEPLLGSSR
jgi:hypothetical protein